ncbi:hypothetical protein J3E74DRAFT_455881 [Bipolaris maydis]|nr:hypothetical protein J3E74DRAFT_455881 [Bipolaris maydis]
MPSLSLHTMPPPPVSTAPSPTPLLPTTPTILPPPLDQAFKHDVDRAVSRTILQAMHRTINVVVDNIHDLYTGRLDWSEHETVHLTSAQHIMLSRLFPSQWNGSNPIIMDILDFAGRLCFTRYCGNSSASKFAENILRVTQDMASATEEESALYWNHKIILLLNKHVQVELDGESYSGILMGATTLKAPDGPPLPFGVYRIQLSKSTELFLDLQKLGNEDARILELSEERMRMESEGV